ncbi:PP2C family protein-serine/threonine phosphatase [Streptomyces flavidovirens]|uniref:PP2C family protein-serine/threonine phosphatase n=1 Tax=Streptomyces flavidovirens TaxID=67298 RepID=UPI003443AB57
MHEPAPTATGRNSAGRARVVPPLVLLGAVAVADLATPDWLHVLPVMAAVPVLAAATNGVWVTAVLAGATLGATVLLEIRQELWERPDSDVTILTLVVVSLASLLACSVRQRRERELRQVRSVAEAAQRALLRPLPRRIHSLALSGTYLAAESEARIGGDFYEALHTPYGTRLLIGDVRGKGLPAVGASAALLGSFRQAAYQEKSLADVARRLEESVNRQIEAVHGELFTERFATALLVEIPSAEPVARLVHCGHPEPLMIRAGRVEAHLPEPPGAPIGLADLVGADPVTQCVPFAEGDRMVLYTDGFIETRDRAGRFYDLVGRARARSTQPLDDLVAGLRADLLRHATGDLEDDAALLVIERSAT